jgi:hypothetical protein
MVEQSSYFVTDRRQREYEMKGPGTRNNPKGHTPEDLFLSSRSHPPPKFPLPQQPIKL